MKKNQIKVFFLNASVRDEKGIMEISIYGTDSNSQPIKILITNHSPIFFIKRNEVIPEYISFHRRRRLELRNPEGEYIDGLYFKGYQELRNASKKLRSAGIRVFETDIDPVNRYLMERFIHSSAIIEGEYRSDGRMLCFENPAIKPTDFIPDLKIFSFDLETDISNGEIVSFSFQTIHKNSSIQGTYLITEEESGNNSYIRCGNEKELIQQLINEITLQDPDIITGWNIFGFDLKILISRAKLNRIQLTIGRDYGLLYYRVTTRGSDYYSLQGRILLDGIKAVRSGFFNFDDYSLETVSTFLLGEGKKIDPSKNKLPELKRMRFTAPDEFAEYNLQDAILVNRILRKSRIIDQFIARAKISGLFIENLSSMTDAFDFIFLPRLHRKGFVWIDKADVIAGSHAAGGYVFEPAPGIYKDVSVLDFKSLYPSIIRTFKIDPYSRFMHNVSEIKTPNGITFSKQEHILPDYLEYLFEQRTEAKRNKDDQLSHAVKILMNSFYGVMGSYGCRFYNPDLPNAITGTGQWILLESRIFLMSKGFEVIYGDTDSLFITGNQNNSRSTAIADVLNDYWTERIRKEFDLVSYLEIEYEKFYDKFVLAPSRSGETGAKKRYAGLVMSRDEPSLEFTGMEFVRSDWTELSQIFQEGLYLRILTERPFEEWIREFVQKLFNSELDHLLIYKKRLRKKTEKYDKTTPPHVKAARLIGIESGTVRYRMTTKGPEPPGFSNSAYDYAHYLEKQIKPVAQGILSLVGKDIDNIISKSGEILLI
ncbi:MAG: DNA polymerase II [Ignavibacteriales bacterium]|nr:DNA polymerase II [Ignavibacteriales bacterium]